MKNNFDLSPAELSAIQKAVSSMPFYELEDDLVAYVDAMSLSINRKIASSSTFTVEEMFFIQEAVGYALDALQGIEPLDEEHLAELKPFVFTFNSLASRLSSSLNQ